MTLYLHPAMSAVAIFDFCMAHNREVFFRYVPKAKVSRKPLMIAVALKRDRKP